MENGAIHLQLLPELQGVYEISVVGKSHSSFDMIYDYGLGVGSVVAARRSVSDVSHGHISLSKAFYDGLCEHVVHKTDVLMGRKKPVVVYNNTAAFLSPVLKGEKSVIHHRRQVGCLVGENSENAAFLS